MLRDRRDSNLIISLIEHTEHAEQVRCRLCKIAFFGQVERRFAGSEPKISFAGCGSLRIQSEARTGRVMAQ